MLRCVIGLCAAMWGETLFAQAPQSGASSDAWARAIVQPSERGTLQDAYQFVRGDKGKWSDEPVLIVAPQPAKGVDKQALDDWVDQLVEQGVSGSTTASDTWLLCRTQQYDDNDRVWIESIERSDNRFTVALDEAIWQGKYFKTFTYYQVHGVNLGKLPAGEYEAVWIVQPRTFKQFNGDGRPKPESWPKDDTPTEAKPVELRVKFRVTKG